MKFSPTKLHGVWLIELQRHTDARGYFCETFRRDLFEKETGIHFDIVQANESMSARGVVRGLHFQAGEASQAKLVRVCTGAIVDVAVDLRRNSPTYGQYIAEKLSEENGRSLFIPRGFAHGFAVMADNTRFEYLVDNVYNPAAERTLNLFDPTVAVEWPLPTAEAILSDKDRKGLLWDSCEKF